MDPFLAVAHCQDSRVPRPLSVPHRVPTKPEPDLIWTGPASICEGWRLRPKRGEVSDDLSQLCYSGSNSKTKRYTHTYWVRLKGFYVVERFSVHFSENCSEAIGGSGAAEGNSKP